MKKLFILLIGIAFFNCVQSIENVPTCSTLKEIDNYVFNNIKYVHDNGDEWQTPEETLSKRTGDCEDMAILWLYLANQSGFGKGALGIYHSIDRKKGHAVAELGDHRFYMVTACPVHIISYSYDIAIGLSIIRNKENER